MISTIADLFGRVCEIAHMAVHHPDAPEATAFTIVAIFAALLAPDR